MRPILGSQIAVGDRYNTFDYGMVTVEALRPRNPKYPNCVEVETTRGYRQLEADRTYWIER